MICQSFYHYKSNEHKRYNMVNDAVKDTHSTTTIIIKHKIHIRPHRKQLCKQRFQIFYIFMRKLSECHIVSLETSNEPQYKNE